MLGSYSSVESLLDAAVKPKLRFKVGELVFCSCSGLVEIEALSLLVWCGSSGTYIASSILLIGSLVLCTEWSF